MREEVLVANEETKVRQHEIDPSYHEKFYSKFRRPYRITFRALNQLVICWRYKKARRTLTQGSEDNQIKFMQSESSRPLYRGAQVVWYSLYVIETLLIVRFLLKLLAANPEAAFSNLIYSLSYIFVWPFVTVFSNFNVQGSIFEWTTLLAMVVYWLLATAIIKLFVMSKSVSTLEADIKLSEDN